MLPYMPFYLDGREARRPRLDIKVPKLAEAVLEEGKLRDALHRVVHEELTFSAKQKRKWIADNKEQISTVGCTDDEAWNAYVRGVEDEAVFGLESQVIEEMTNIVDGGEYFGEQDGDEDDDDAEDEEDEDDDDEGEDEE